MKRGNDDGWDAKGTTLLHAIDEAQIDTVKRLVEEGVPLNRRYHISYEYENVHAAPVSPLDLAVWFFRPKFTVQVVEIFLKNGANPTLCDDSLLRDACHGPFTDEHVILVDLLIQHGATFDSNWRDQHGSTFLFNICDWEMSAPIEILERILSHGVPINATNNYGQNALFGAVENRDLRCMRFLLKRGIDVLPIRRTRLASCIILYGGSERYSLLRLAWERGMKTIDDRKLARMINLPCSWSPEHHWLYSDEFRMRARTVLLVWYRMGRRFGLPRQKASFIIARMALGERRTRFEPSL